MENTPPRPDTINALRYGADSALAMLAVMQLEVFTPLQHGSMTTKQIVYAALLVPFLALSGYVIATMGFSGFYAAAGANAATELMLMDLTIALGLMGVWMFFDARDHGFSAIPYLVIAAILGVAGPLLYLIRREAFTRIQRVFEEKGIQFAPRRVLVEASTPQEAIKGAAAVLDQEVEGGSAPKNNPSNQ